MRGLHLFLGLLECRRNDLFLSFEVALAVPEDVDLLGEPLRFCSGAREFGFCRSEISSGAIVGAPRDTGAGRESGETQHSDCCSANLIASPHGVVFSAIT